MRLQRALGLALVIAFGMTGCERSSDITDIPTTDGPRVSVAHRDVELVQFTAEGQSQRFVFPHPTSGGEELFPHVRMRGQKPKSFTGATVESRGSIAPPRVGGIDVQLTDIVIESVAGGSWAYAVANVAGDEVAGAMQIFDLSQRFAPRMLSEVLVADAEYASVLPLREVAYALGADANGALIDIFDVRDAGNPVLLQRMPLLGKIALAAWRDGNDLWVASGVEGGVTRFDVTDPFAPVEVSYLDVADARDVTRYRKSTLVLTGEGVHFLEDAGSAKFVALSDLPPQPPTRAEWRDRKWVVNTNTGLVEIDARKRKAKTLMPVNGGTANGVGYDGGTLLMRANGEAGIQVVHADGKDMYDLGWLDLANAGSANSVAAGDGFLISGDGRGGVLLAEVQYDIFDDFEGNLIQPYPWVEVSGDWYTTEVDGQNVFQCPLMGNPEDRRAFWGVDTKWRDFQFDARILLDAGDGCGLYFRAQDIWDDAKQDAYIFQYDPGFETGAFLIRRIKNGRESAPIAVTYKADVPELADTPWYGEWRDIRIEAVGTQLRVWVDGILVVDVEDEEYESGSIGVRAWRGSQPLFDDFRITELN